MFVNELITQDTSVLLKNALVARLFGTRFALTHIDLRDQVLEVMLVG